MAECKTTYIPLSEGQIFINDMKSPYVNSTHYCRLVSNIPHHHSTEPRLCNQPGE
jgi:hypothetical protein